MHITPLLPEDDLLKLPILALPGTAGNEEVRYTALQNLMLPYSDTIHLVWWALLVATLGFLIVRYLLWARLADNTLPAAPEPQPPMHRSGILGIYYRVFSIGEIDRDPMLRWAGGAILLGFLASFSQWQTNPQIAGYGNLCWPFFQQCRDWIFLEGLPASYMQMIFFMGLFTLIITAAYALATRRTVLAHGCIILLYIAKAYFTLINFKFNGNYDYYHTVFGIVFLLLPHKRFFMSLSIVMLYTLSTVAKIHPSWTFGLYFTPLAPGMPIFPNPIVPLMTNLVIFMEMIMAWFLFSRRVWLQRSVFAFFCLFHLYSGMMVDYHYPTIVMPMLIICFGGMFRPFSHVPRDRASLPGWMLMAGLWSLQLIQLIIPGDAKLTLEGNFYGLYMFEANHQCMVTITNADGVLLEKEASTRARGRCNPWSYLSRAQYRYCRLDPKPILKFSMIHSINGGPFYKIIDEPDLCSLTYHPFKHNLWIKDATTAPAVARPLKNFYY